MNRVNSNINARILGYSNYVGDEFCEHEIIKNNSCIKSLYEEITEVEPNFFDDCVYFSYVDIVSRDFESLPKYLNYNKNSIKIDTVKYFIYNFYVKQDYLYDLPKELILHIFDLFNVNNCVIVHQCLLIEQQFHDLFYDKFDTETSNYKYYNKWKIKKGNPFKYISNKTQKR